MKRETMAWLVTACLVLGMAVVPAFAQTGSKLTAEVPFNFYVADQKMAAGEYSVIQPMGSAVVLLGTKGDKAAMITHSKESLEPAGFGKLVFNRYGSQYFLAQVWTRGNSVGRELPISEAEREAKRTGGAQRLAIRLERLNEAN